MAVHLGTFGTLEELWRRIEEFVPRGKRLILFHAGGRWIAQVIEEEDEAGHHIVSWADYGNTPMSALEHLLWCMVPPSVMMDWLALGRTPPSADTQD